MKRKLLMAALLLGVACVALADVFTGLSGKWTGKIITPDGNSLQIYYVFKVDGDKLTGTGQGDGDPTAIDSGIVKGNNFSFSISSPQGALFKHTGIYYPQGDSVGLNVTIQGAVHHVTLNRQAN